jgi:hypothetical protein
MSKDINTSDVVETDYDKFQFETEVACDALINEAIKNGTLKVAVNPHLMYLPDQNATRVFKEACRTVINCLKEVEEQHE